MLAYVDYNKQRKRRGKFRNITKEERAEILGNVVCPRCGYQNRMFYARKYGTCHLCRTTIDVYHFKRKLLEELRRN